MTTANPYSTAGSIGLVAFPRWKRRAASVRSPRSSAFTPAGSQKCTLSLGIDPWVISAQVGKFVVQLINSGFVLIEPGRVPHRPLMQRRQLTGMA